MEPKEYASYYTWKEYKEESHFIIRLSGISNNRFEVVRISIDSENGITSTDTFNNYTMIKANNMFRAWVAERI